MNMWRLLVAGLICTAAAVAGEPVKLDSAFNIDEVTYGNDQQGQILMEQNPPKFTPDVPEYHDMLIKGACDVRGEFNFSTVPAGDYFVIAFIIWDDASGRTPRKTGGGVMKRIQVPALSGVPAGTSTGPDSRQNSQSPPALPAGSIGRCSASRSASPAPVPFARSA